MTSKADKPVTEPEFLKLVINIEQLSLLSYQTQRVQGQGLRGEGWENRSHSYLVRKLVYEILELKMEKSERFFIGAWTQSRPFLYSKQNLSKATIQTTVLGDNWSGAVFSVRLRYGILGLEFFPCRETLFLSHFSV